MSSRARCPTVWLLFAFAIALASGSASAPLAAQTVVMAVDRAGVPVPSAHIELWSATQRVAMVTTDHDGIARIAVDPRRSPRSVIARKIGYRPGHLLVADLGDTLRVHMEVIERSLPEVTVRAAQRACPRPDDTEARRVWREAAAHYETPSITGRKADVEGRRTTVTEQEVGSVDESPRSTGWRLYTDDGMSGARNGLAQGGYVRALTGSHSFDDFGVWWYPPLHAELAGYFVDSLFGAHHTLSVNTTDRRTTVIQFCARDRKRSGLDGLLRVDASGALLDARWRYWNPSRDAEPAGGEVMFAPPVEQGAGPLYSASGLYWRRLRSGMYLQSWQWYAEWERLRQ